MRVLVTGARGKVGRATVAALQEAGHDVRATDLTAPVFERPEEGEADYVQADLTDAGDAFAVVRGAEAVVHTAAIPEPTNNPPHVVFQNNLMATFNTLEAAIRFGVSRFVNISSETVPGFFFPERPVPSRLRARGRGTSDPSPGPLRDRQVFRRAADGRRYPALGHPLHLDPALLGATRGQLRAQPRAAGPRPARS